MIYEIFAPALSLIFSFPAPTNTIQTRHISYSCKRSSLTVDTTEKLITTTPSAKENKDKALRHIES
jgi:hypothetical protein